MYYLTVVLLFPLPYHTPPPFSRALWRIMVEKVKKWRRSEGRVHVKSVLFLLFVFASLSIDPSINLAISINKKIKTHPTWFLSVLSWLVTPACTMCWFTVTLCQHIPAVCEINPSDPVVMKLQVCIVCVCVVVNGCLLSQHANNGSTTGNGVVCTLLTMLCRPKGLLCTVCMVSLRGRSERRVKEMRDKWIGGQMNTEACTN